MRQLRDREVAVQMRQPADRADGPLGGSVEIALREAPAAVAFGD